MIKTVIWIQVAMFLMLYFVTLNQLAKVASLNVTLKLQINQMKAHNHRFEKWLDEINAPIKQDDEQHRMSLKDICPTRPFNNIGPKT